MDIRWDLASLPRWVDGSVWQMLPLSYLMDSESPWWAISLFLFFFGGGAGVPHVMWNPSSPTRDRTHASALESQSPSPWTTRAVPFLSLLQTPYMF